MIYASLPSFTEEDESAFERSMFQIKNGNYCIDDESTYADALVIIEKKLVRLAKETDGVGIDTKRYERLFLFENIRDNFNTYFPLSRFSPYIELYLEFIKKFMNNINKFDKMEEIDRREFLKKLKEELNSDNFRRKVLQVRKNISNNKKSMLDYINDLFLYRSKLLVVRVDLKYNIYSEEYIIIHGVKFFIHKNVSFKDERDFKFFGRETQKHKNKLVKRIKKIYGTDLIGYIWNIRYGEKKGFYYQMIFFLDGNKHKEGSCIAESIGNLWVNEITQKEGLYSNLNLENKLIGNNKYMVTDIIKYDDKQLRKKLDRMVTYLVKNEYFLKLVIDRKSHSYDRGQSPKKKKVGRPQK